MSAPTVRQVVTAHQGRLDGDASAFAAALVHFFDTARSASEPPVQAPPEVRAAVTRWRRHVAGARADVAALPDGAAGRRLALASLDALVAALRDLGAALAASAPAAAAAAAARAVDGYATFERLNDRLDRALP